MNTPAILSCVFTVDWFLSCNIVTLFTKNCDAMFSSVIVRPNRTGLGFLFEQLIMSIILYAVSFFDGKQ